ncbi:MAG: linear amide C-N hydrolase [Planctomycetes bacterium]|nr:linear amide C-N hydrolase [Planctomycetota bacterium]
MTQLNRQHKKTHRVIKITLVLAVLVLVPAGCIFNDCRTLASFRKVDTYPLYVMKYYGNYGTKDFQTGGGLNFIERWGYKKLMPQSNHPQCSCFAAINPQSDHIFGRNFDWNTKAALLLFTNPSDGYASASMVDITYFGFGGKKPGLLSRFALLHAPQLPFDGMNECGLAVGIMAIPHSEGGNDPNKETLGFMQLIRQMLDHAGTVDEAVALAQKYNIVFTHSPTNHLLVSDTGGNSAVIEFLDGGAVVTRNSRPFQVATNNIVADQDEGQLINSCPRYKKMCQTLQRTDGQLDPQQAMILLQTIAQPKFTVWSAVYGQSTGEIQLAMGRQYDKIYGFSLKMKNKENTKTSIYPKPPAKAIIPNPVEQSVSK